MKSPLSFFFHQTATPPIEHPKERLINAFGFADVPA
jgi:hypothetical protein